MKIFLFAILTSLLVSGLVSCSSVKSTMKKVGDPVASLAKNNLERLKDLRLPGTSGANSKTPPVVKVRREDLREVQFGREKALAWTRSKENGGGTLYFPVDFDPSNLPSGGPLPSTGILPSIGSADSGTSPTDPDEIPDLSRSDFEGPDDQ